MIKNRGVFTVWDHIVVASFALALPLYARYNYPRFRERIASGVPDARAKQYRGTIVRQWALTLAALAVWLGQGRSLEALGLRLSPTSRFIAAAMIGFGLFAVWRSMLRAAVAEPEARAKVVVRLEPVRALLPSTARELSYFIALAVTAGICEEILFRGYLMAYVQPIAGVAGAVVVSSVLFGLGHIYQGLSQAIKIIFVGFVLALFYVASDSLYISMVLHAAFDAVQGRLAFGLLTDPEPST